MFPCPAWCIFSFSASGGRAAAATGAAGGFYVSLYNQWYNKNWSKTTIVFLGFQKGRWALFGLDFGAVPSFRATVFPCPAGCVFSFGRKSSSSNRSSRRVLCLIVQTAVQKLVENFCFSRVSEGTLGTFWARFWRRSVLQGHCVSLSGRVHFQLREEEQQ